MEENLTFDFGDKNNMVRAKIEILPDGAFDIIDIWKKPCEEYLGGKTSETRVLDVK